MKFGGVISEKELIGSMILICLFVPLSSATTNFSTERLPVTFIKEDLANEGAANFTSYLGGSGQEDASKIALDAEGNTIIIGQTKSSNFPVTPNAIQLNYSGSGEWDAFVTKFNLDGTLNFSTYLGGTQYEHITTVTSDSELNLIVTGVTYSSEFPVTDDALHDSQMGNGDGFLMKISPNGSLIYSTFFGGAGDDWIYGLELDDDGNFMFSGYTSSPGLATAGAYQQTIGGGEDAFVAKVSSDGQSVLAFSYLGGSNSDRGWSMTVDSNHNYLVSGRTLSSNFPIVGSAYQSTYGGSDDAFLAKISEDCSAAIFSTYLGGDAEDVGVGLDVDGLDNIYLSGFTASEDFPVSDAYQSVYGGGAFDGYFVKFNQTGVVLYASYFGGDSSDRIWDLRVDQSDSFVMIGRTFSDDLPIKNARQPARAGLEDFFVTRMCSCGQILLVSTYYGGSGTDFGEGIAVGPDGHIVVSGMSYSNNIPITDDAYQPERAGNIDALVVHNVLDYMPITSTSSTTESSSTSSQSVQSTTRTITNTSNTSTPSVPVTPNQPVVLYIGIGLSIVLIILVIGVQRRR